MASRLSVFLAELRRRKVARVAVVYALVGIGVIEAAQLLFDAFEIPRIAWQIVVFLTVLGLPIALVLAWALDVTPEGIQRTPAITPEELASEASPASVRGWTALATVLLVVILAAGYLLFYRDQGEELDNRLVAVAIFENLTGDPSLDHVGRMAAEEVINGILRTGLVRVVPMETVLGFSRRAAAEGGSASGPGSVDRLAEATGAGVAVSGSYYLEDDNLRIQSYITDRVRGQPIGPVDPAMGVRTTPGMAVARLVERVVASVSMWANPLFSGERSFLQMPCSYAAYQEYAIGIDFFVVGDMERAKPYFRRAMTLDSLCPAPVLQAIVTHWNLGERAVADSLTAFLEQHVERLTSVQRAWVEMYRAWFEGDRAGAYRAAQEARRIAPGSIWEFQAGYEALKMNRPREAAQLISGVDLDSPIARGWLTNWVRLAEALHMLGRHEEELDVARQAKTRFPGRPEVFVMEVQALVGSGNVEGAMAVLDEARRLGSVDGWRPSDLGLVAAQEFRAHGHAGPALEILEGVIARERGEDGEGLRLVQALYSAGRWEEARAVLNGLSPWGEDELAFLRYSGALAARLGDREEALRISEALSALDRPYTWGGPTFDRARIAALLGEAEEAVRLLRQAHGQGLGFDISWHRDMDLEPLRGYPPFEEFLRPKG